MEGQRDTPQEFAAGMRRANGIARVILERACAAVAPGVSTDALDELVHALCVEHGAYPAPLGYRNFPKSVCTSVNECVCHGIPDARPLDEGDVLTIDVSVYVDGFYGDNAMTVGVGTVSAATQDLMAVAKECMMAGIAVAADGVPYREVGRSVAEAATKHGFDSVRDFGGHAIGRSLHLPPTIPFVAESFLPADLLMKTGDAFTVEPMVTAGREDSALQGIVQVAHWPDNWSVVSASGERAAQYEHCVLVSDDGAEIITDAKYAEMPAPTT